MAGGRRRLTRKHLTEAATRRMRAARAVLRGLPAAQDSPAPPGSDARQEQEPLLAALREGRSLTAGLVDEVRDRLERGDVSGATAMSAALRREPAMAQVGALCFGIVAFHRGFRPLAWHELRTTPRALWSRFAPTEFSQSGVEQDVERALDEVRALLAEPPAHMDAAHWMEVLEPVFGAGAMDLARDLFNELDAALARQSDVDPALTVKRDWMRRWIDLSPDSPSAPKGAADVSFAIVDYDHPGRSRASANIGDHVQTLASLGHLVRRQDLHYEGPEQLVDLVTQLSHRVRPERRRTDHQAVVQVLTVDRDASTYNAVPENTWMLAFGWYMHALFRVRHAFPFHEHLQPIFISFHCNKRSMLTPEAIEYMRAHGPIGCRDWTTVDILLSVDVPAFFSGCLTTTVDTLFPDVAGAFPASAPVAYVDAPDDAPPDAVTYQHSSDEVRFRSLAGNVYEAVHLLDTYRRHHSGVVTSRLHCYLPMRSIGARVDFRPRNRSDIRFAGLIDIDDQQFDAIRTGINQRLESVFEAILAGGSRDEVYALWRDLCADDVAAARRRRAAATPAPARPAEVHAVAHHAVASSRTSGAPAADAVHVAIRVNRPRAQVLNVLAHSLVRHCSRPLHLWLLDGTEKGVDLHEVGARARGNAVTVVPVHDLGSGLRSIETRSGRATHGLEVLLLGELLPHVDRVLVLPQESLVEGDVAELMALDLGGHLLAAPDVSAGDTSGFGVLHRAGNRLRSRTRVATELRRQAHARHVFDFTAFSADVLVLDLAALRASDVVPEFVRLVEDFGLDAREVLHFQFGPHRAVVPAAWHFVPTRHHVDSPALVHWADPVKPWRPDYAPEQERWLESRRRMREELARL